MSNTYLGPYVRTLDTLDRLHLTVDGAELPCDTTVEGRFEEEFEEAKAD
jgi:hypothetical protein